MVLTLGNDAVSSHGYIWDAPNVTLKLPRQACILCTEHERFVLDRGSVECFDNAAGVRLYRCNKSSLIDSDLRGGAQYPHASLEIRNSGDLQIIDTKTHHGQRCLILEAANTVEILRHEAVACDTGMYIYSSGAVVVDDSAIENNRGQGVGLYHSQPVQLLDNRIRYNSENGIRLEVSSPVSILGNVITGNGGRGISYPSTEIPFTITIDDFDGTTARGTSDAPDDSTVEVFVDDGGQGEELVGTGSLLGGDFAVPVTVLPQMAGRQLTATVTSPAPNRATSEFSPPWPL